VIEQRWQAFGDFRSLAEIKIQRDGRVQQLAGVLLLRAPGALRFEALSAFGPPILLVGAAPDRVTIWEVLKNRAFILPSSPDANRRWLGLALGAEDGRVGHLLSEGVLEDVCGVGTVRLRNHELEAQQVPEACLEAPGGLHRLS